MKTQLLIIGLSLFRKAFDWLVSIDFFFWLAYFVIPAIIFCFGAYWIFSRGKKMDKWFNENSSSRFWGLFGF